MADPRPRSELLDRVLSASAAVVALSALAVSVYQAKITREQQKMSAWPRIDMPMSTGGSIYARKVRNVGLGPALVRSVVVTVDGRPVHGWEDAVRALVGDSLLRAMTRDTTMHAETNSVLRGSVLLPGTAIDHVRIEGGGIPRRVYEASKKRLSTRVCYCSLYDDCWRIASGEEEPTPVAACPVARDSTREFGG